MRGGIGDARECRPVPESSASSTTKTSNTTRYTSEAAVYTVQAQVTGSVQAPNAIQISNTGQTENNSASTDKNQHVQSKHEFTSNCAKVFDTAVCADRAISNQHHVSDKPVSDKKIHTHSRAFRRNLGVVTAFDHTNKLQDVDARHAIRAQQYRYAKPYVVAHSHISVRQFIQHKNDT